MALARPHLRLVTGPVQPPPKQSPYRAWVIGDAEVLANELGHTGRGPQFVGKAVDRGSLEQETLQLVHLRIGQPASGPGNRFGAEILPLPSHPSPAMQGRRADAKNASDHR